MEEIIMAKVKDVQKKKQIVKVTLDDGKVRVIHFDLNAFAELETRFGSIQEAMKALSSGMMKNIKVILWAGLIHEEVSEFDEDGEPMGYNITPYTVGKLVTPDKMEEVSKKVMEAMGFAMPDPENLPQEVKNQMKEMGIELPGGHKLATVAPTEEEIKAEEDAKAKN
jgi:hypothetical protein